MAVYTVLSDADVTALLALYDLGALVSCEGVAEGVENTNYKLTTERGRFILTIFEKRTQAADLPFFIAVMERLAARGFPAPRPAATRAGGYLARVKDKPALIVSHLDGVWPRTWDAAHCAAVGEALARMHLALDGFAGARANALSLRGWETLLVPRLDDAEKLRPGLADLVRKDMMAARMAWRKDLPQGVIHADLFPDNALFEGGALTGVIDFYFACTDALAYDLAVCLNAWCFDGPRYDLERGRAMIGAYEGVRPLSKLERDMLPHLARGAALRFFATRLADWTATPAGATVTPKDPLEYADKLAFHRKTRGASDYGA
ncbi:MAG: homoserine kinase [Proteobacteria bacterium HN_bin10]|nr:MAG: homoserine kinase [Proteobacteria bacterium HN_bin10]